MSLIRRLSRQGAVAGMVLLCGLLGACGFTWPSAKPAENVGHGQGLEQTPQGILRAMWSFCPYRLSLIGPVIARKMGENPPDPAWMGLDLEYRAVQAIVQRQQRRPVSAVDAAALAELARIEALERPRSAQARRALGLANYLNARLDEARTALDAARELEPGSPYTAMAALLVDIELSEQNPRASAGETSMDSGRNQVDPLRSLPAFWLTMAREAELQGDVQQAEFAYRRAIQTDQANTAAMVGLARLEMDQAQTQAVAAERLAQVLAINASDEVALFNLALTRLRLGRLDQALDAAQRLVELVPNDAPAWELNGLVQRALGRWTDAEAALRRATELDPRMAGAFYNLGAICAEQLSDSACAGEAFARYLDLEPEGERAETVRDWLRKRFDPVTE